MLRLVSINLNKRLNAPHTRQALQRWLWPLQATILAAQEPVAAGKPLPTEIDGLHLIAGNENVAFWLRKSSVISARLLPIPALIIELEAICICNTYLSSVTSTRRKHQLEELKSELSQLQKPVVVVGDFNLAPLAADGLYGEHPSSWTTQSERTAFLQMMNKLDLIDLTSALRLGEQHFTFERVNKTKWTRFRCDLAFAPAQSEWTARYDHSVRTGSFAFTDHSACIIEHDTD